MKQPFVVVWDPWGVLAAGTYMDARGVAFHEARARGVAFLPARYDPLGAGSVAFAAIGAGVLFDQNKPETGAPMLLLSRRATRLIHWAARIVAASDAPSGRMRLVRSSTQPYTLPARIEDNEIILNDFAREATAAGPRGVAPTFGWTVGGSHRYQGEEGYVGVCLQAVARNTLVLWAAASVTDE